MKTKNMRLAILGAVLLLSLGSAHAQIYKWIDARGVTQYSDKPPVASSETEQLDIALSGYGSAGETPGCQTIRCQYERLRNDRLEDEKQAQLNAQSRASVVVNQQPQSTLSPRSSITYGTRWPGYGGVGTFGRFAPVPFGFAPWNPGVAPPMSAPADTGTRLLGPHQ